MSPIRSTKRTRISLASGAGEARSPVGVLGAVLLHAAVVAATLFTWEHRLDIIEQTVPVVPVDLVTLAAKTNVRAEIPPTPKFEPKPMPQIEPEQPQTMQLPDLKETELAPQAQPVPKVPPVPKSRPQPKPDTNKFDLNKLAAEFDKPQPKGKVSPNPHASAGEGTEMTADLETIFMNAIRRCYNVGVLSGAPNPEQLMVSMNLSLNPDGTVATPPHLTAESESAAKSNPYVRASGDAAIRAIYACQPYKLLPVNRYAEWRSSRISFTPQDFANQ